MKPLLPGPLTTLLVFVIAGSCLSKTGAFAADKPADNNADKSSLIDSDMETTEAKLALDGAERENTALRRDLAITRQQVSALTDSLVLANSESEVFKRETSDLKLRLEGLGLDAASPDRTLLDDRLLKAVSDLRIVSDQRDKLSAQVISMMEAIIRYLKTASSVDGDARMALETEMRSATQLLGIAGAPGAAQPVSNDTGSLTDARAISVKEDLALVVINLGRRQGVKIGMPFQVLHDGLKVGIVRVVDVRENICGAVIQSLDQSEKVNVGDVLRVDARM